jgi:hypothetical protein
MNKEIGVVIQGPLITYGQGPNISVSGFNTLETILLNIERIQKIGFEYVISTWEIGDYDTESHNIMNQLKTRQAKILISPVPNLFDPDNRLKQKISIIRGIERLQKLNCKYIVKVRTDMIIPKEFWQEEIHRIVKIKDKIYVSEILNSPFYIGDFIVAGEISYFSKILNSMIIQKKYHPRIASNDGLQLYNTQDSLDKYSAVKFLLFLVIRKAKLIRDWEELIKKRIVIGNRNIFENIVWRGLKMSEVIPCEKFIFNGEVTKFNVQSFKEMIFVYKKYLCLVMKKINTIIGRSL